MKIFSHLFQNIFLILLLPLILLIGIDNSSKLFSKLCEVMGPKYFLKRHRIILINLKICFPEMSDVEINNLAVNVWKNFGAVLGDLFFWKFMSAKQLKKRISLNDFCGMLNKKGAKVIASCHLSNFEILTRISTDNVINVFYKEQKNKFFNKIMLWFRSSKFIVMRSRIKGLIEGLKKGEAVFILADQRPSDGVDSYFFGKKVKTISVPAKLVLNKKIDLFFCFVNSVGVAKYNINIEKIEILDSDDIFDVTQKINDSIEAAVKKFPEQWFWFHRRFDKSVYDSFGGK